MKLSKGRGIQFFKKPFFDGHKGFAANIFRASKKGLTSAFNFVTKNKKEKK